MKRKSKPKTQEQMDKATDARLRKTYGISLEQYNARLERQGGVCQICGRPPVSRRLHVDHDHSYTKIPIETIKVASGWAAESFYREIYIGDFDQKKTLAVRKVRQKLKVASCRGLLCVHCNRGLQFYSDNPTFLQNASEYIRSFNDFYLS